MIVCLYFAYSYQPTFEVFKEIFYFLQILAHSYFITFVVIVLGSFFDCKKDL